MEYEIEEFPGSDYEENFTESCDCYFYDEQDDAANGFARGE